MKIFKITIQIFAIIGVILSLCELTGVFQDKDKVSFFNLIENQNKSDIKNTGATKFLNFFVLDNPNFSGIKTSDIKEITIHAIGMGSNLTNKAEIISGYLILKNHNGKISEKICTIQELKEWTKEAPFWKWFSWSLVAISTLLGTFVLVFELKIKKENS